MPQDSPASSATPASVSAATSASRPLHSPAPARNTTSGKRSRLGRTLGWLLLVLMLGLLAARYYWQQRPQPLAADALISLQRGDIEDSVTALGTLQPRDYVDVGAQVSGQLKSLLVQIGDTVKSGELLAEIDATVQSSRVEADRAQLQGLKAQLQEKQASLVLAQQLFKRQQGLLKDKATSEENYQNSAATLKITEAQIAALQAQIVQAQSTLKGEEATLGYTKIYAPMAGTVVTLDARQGQTLNANQQAPILLRIADLSTMTVWTQVSEADVPKLKLGMPAYFTTLGSPDKRWQGSLRQLLPTPDVTNNVVLYTALFDVANPQGTLMSQMTAQVSFIVASAHNVLRVPLAALKSNPHQADLFWATVVDARGQTQRREVKIGVRNRNYGEVLSGLQEGDRILATARASSAGNRSSGGGRPPHVPGL